MPENDFPSDSMRTFASPRRESKATAASVCRRSRSTSLPTGTRGDGGVRIPAQADINRSRIRQQPHFEICRSGLTDATATHRSESFQFFSDPFGLRIEFESFAVGATGFIGVPRSAIDIAQVFAHQRIVGEQFDRLFQRLAGFRQAV